MTELSFYECCEKATKKLTEVGVRNITSRNTVVKYLRIFRKDRRLTPSSNKVHSPPSIFQYAPEATSYMEEWATKNLESLSAERFMNYIAHDLPQQLRLLDPTLETIESFCNITLSTAWRKKPIMLLL